MSQDAFPQPHIAKKPIINITATSPEYLYEKDVCYISGPSEIKMCKGNSPLSCNLRDIINV